MVWEEKESWEPDKGMRLTNIRLRWLGEKQQTGVVGNRERKPLHRKRVLMPAEKKIRKEAFPKDASTLTAEVIAIKPSLSKISYRDRNIHRFP